MSTTDAQRLFLGVRVSVATANALAQCAEQLARRAKDSGIDIRWLPPTSYHVTLKFLGWVHADAIAAIRDAAATAIAGTPPFRFRTSRLGAFGSLEAASVVWAGIEASEPMMKLAASIDRAMSEIGFAIETRPFTAHVTLGRLRETRPVRDVVLPMSEQMFSETRVDHVTLYESETKPTGSAYKEIAKIGFDPAETSPIRSENRQTEPVDLGDTDNETDDGWPRGEPQGDHK
ncbi:MAG TPA: RNA 2',3'-cyclic phosphodiesterase [Kofleriaceae bacterium]|jgi:2'-5' RNA ligase|nr:RNA 2',3'-cyclic phosphodiesterase [Kofleriaceae bacterium]